VSAQDIGPFPAAPSVPFTRGDTDLNDRVAQVAALPDLMNRCAALVDLTGDPVQPPFAGFNDDRMIYPGSLQKISVLFAAFALRAQVAAFAAAAVADGLSTSAPDWPANVIRAMQAAWQPVLDAQFPGLPKGFPQLATIFAFGPDGGVDFTEAAPSLTDAEIDAIGEFGAPRGFYLDALRGMLRWSNNAAASASILPLSYPYINGALSAAGLMSADHTQGLWVSGDYMGHDWMPNTGNPQANAAGRLLDPTWQQAQRRQRSNFTATAGQIATLLTLMATGALLDAASSQQMRGLLSAADGGIGSYVREALSGDHRPADSIRSKIGVGDDARSHDCAIVQRTLSNGTAIRYVVVGLGSDPGQDLNHLDRKMLDVLFVQLDDVIVQRHS
jgi:hypothetical protein